MARGTDGVAFRSAANARGIGLAKSHGPSFDAWQKFEANPVIKSTEASTTLATTVTTGSTRTTTGECRG